MYIFVFGYAVSFSGQINVLCLMSYVLLYQWDLCEKWLIVNGLAQSTRPCTFVGFEKISILRASPAPDSAGPESDVSIPVGFV